MNILKWTRLCDFLSTRSSEWLTSFPIKMKTIGGYVMVNFEIASSSSFRYINKNHFVTAAADIDDCIKPNAYVSVSFNANVRFEQLILRSKSILLWYSPGCAAVDLSRASFDHYCSTLPAVGLWKRRQRPFVLSCEWSWCRERIAALSCSPLPSTFHGQLTREGGEIDRNMK